MKQFHTFTDGETIMADEAGLVSLRAQYTDYLDNYQELSGCLDDDAYVARGNGFCATQYSPDFVQGQVTKYLQRIRDIDSWLH